MSRGRRQFLGDAARGLGGVALASLLRQSAVGQARADELPRGPAFAPRARRAIWLFMAGAPSQLDLFDYKPELASRFDQELPPSVRGEQRLSTMTSVQDRLPIAPSVFRFDRHGQAGTYVSELLPFTARLVDDFALIKTMHTEAVNHDPGISQINTGSQQGGKPALGAWLSYGLGSANQNLPTFVVMTSRYTQKKNVQALSSRLWDSGFLPTEHGGVTVRSGAEPVLYLGDPPGVDGKARRTMLDGLRAFNRTTLAELHDPQTAARIEQYEMAFRMQAALPELTPGPPTAQELDRYGADVATPGTFAANCLFARGLLERGVRFVQIYHRGWDSHDGLPAKHPVQCKDVDRATHGLVSDLKERGLLEDTLIIWGGEFGRTVYSQGTLTATDYGRDHHPRCFSTWLAGAGIKPGIVHGETDDFSYNVVRDPVHVRDLHATILHQFGLDHDKLSFRHQGFDQKLVGVDAPARVVKEILRT